MIRLRALVSVLGCTAAALTLQGHAHASDDSVVGAAAQALFDEGRALLDAQRVPEACEKFNQSQRLDPSGGTLLNLAVCHEQQGKTASAWLEYGESWSVALRENRPDRALIAKERMAALEPRLSRILLRVRPDCACVVTLDGREVPRPVPDLAVPIDPGEHLLEARAPGKQAFSQRIRIMADAATTELTIPELAPVPVAPPRPPSHQMPPVRAGIVARSRPTSTRRTISYVLAATGLTAAAAGTAFGLQALQFKRLADGECVEGCSRQGADWSHQAVSSASLANVAFLVSLFAAGGSMYLWLTEPVARAPRNATRGGFYLALDRKNGSVGWRAGF